MVQNATAAHRSASRPRALPDQHYLMETYTGERAAGVPDDWCQRMTASKTSN
jgi:hypothetical protein